MDKNKITIQLKFSMIIGCIVDLLMVFIFLIPSLRILIFGESIQFHTPQYEWSMRLIASLGAAWTILLFWASKEPFLRKDVLIFTVFPLMFGAYISTTLGLFTNAITLRFFVLFSIITFAHCPFFLYVWIKARRFESKSAENN